MGDLTKNLSVKEFACDCNADMTCKAKNVAHMPLVVAIQGAADHFANKYNGRAVVTITDGNRCFDNNVNIQMRWAGVSEAVAMLSNSNHLYFIAADHRIKIIVPGGQVLITPRELCDYYKSQDFGGCGIGMYDLPGEFGDRVHLDMKPGRVRLWGGA